MPCAMLAPQSSHAERGIDGRYRLVVGEISGCGGEPPLAVMDKDHHAFVIAPQIHARAHRTVLECSDDCRGACGAFMPPHEAVAIVPADAVLATGREIAVPIDVQVDFKFAHRQPCNVP